MDAARFLSRADMATLNELCPDRPTVVNRSLGGARARLGEYWAPFFTTQPLLSRWEGANDGLVSVESARWGE